MTRRARLQDIEPPRLITEAECAHLLGLSASDFYRRCGAVMVEE